MSFAIEVYTVMPVWARRRLGWQQIKRLCDATDPILATRQRSQEAKATAERLEADVWPHRSFLQLEDAIKVVQKGEHIKPEEDQPKPTEQEMRERIKSKVYKQSDLHEQQIGRWMVSVKTDGQGRWKYEAYQVNGTGRLSSKAKYSSPAQAKEAARQNLP
jgi:hypothetical protein